MRKKVTPLNTTPDGCARSVLATYDKVKWDIVRKAALGRFQQNGIIEIEEDYGEERLQDEVQDAPER